MAAGAALPPEGSEPENSAARPQGEPSPEPKGIDPEVLATAIDTLLARGDDPELSYAPTGWTLLMWVATRGKAETVKALLAAGANAWATSPDGCTVLICGARNSVDPDVLTTLLASGLGSQLQAADSDGATALMWAAKFGSAANVRALLAAGADVSAVDGNRKNALFWAVEREDNEVEALQVLLAAGADANVADSAGCMPLHLAANCWRPDAIALLGGAAADVEAQDGDGNTPLVVACLPCQNPNVCSRCWA